jgi:hypothetical protein
LAKQKPVTFDYDFDSIIRCVTNPVFSKLGSGKTITNISQSLTTLQTFQKQELLDRVFWFANVTLKNFDPPIQKRIKKFGSMTELEDKVTALDKSVRKVILLDEAQNEFDKRLHADKSQIYKTIFLNFFRKYNIEMNFNIVNKNRIELRLDDFSQEVFYPFKLSKTRIFVYDVFYLNHYTIKSDRFFDKYTTEEDIRETLKHKRDYLIKKLSKDKFFKKLILKGSTKRALIFHIRETLHVGSEEANYLYESYVTEYT